MSRFDLPYHKQGDVDDAPSWLVDEGKRLLGYLAEQRRLLGVKTISKTSDFADGSSVTAAWFGDVPKVVYRVGPPPVSSSPIGDFLSGFVLDAWHTNPSAATDFVVLRGLPGTTSGETFKAFYFDNSRAPSSPTFPIGIYRTDLSNRSLFEDGLLNGYTPPHADGVQYAGNVDWRNADESLICTWIGPLSRYVRDDTGLAAGAVTSAAYVFFHGQVLFDCSVLAAGGFFGDTSAYSTTYGGRSGVITGACITKNTTTGKFFLLAVVRFGSYYSSLGPRAEFLVQLEINSVDTRGVTGPTAAIWTLSPAVMPSVYAGNPVILWQQTIDATRGDEAHPWFFNQATTEARCIRSSSTSGEDVAECILKLGSSGWAYSEVVYAPITTAITTFNSPWDSISTVRFPVETALVHYPTPSANGFLSAGQLTDISGHPYWYQPATGYTQELDDGTLCNLGFSTAGHSTSATTADNPWVIRAVDYRANVPVYLKVRGRTKSGQVNTAVSAIDLTDNYVADSITGTWGNTFSYYVTETYKSSLSISGSSSDNDVYGGIQTDWMEVTAVHTTSRAWSSVCDETQTRIFANTVPFVGGGYAGGSSPGELVPASSSYVANATETDVETDVWESVSILYLDMRNKMLAYYKGSATVTTTKNFSGISTQDPLTSGYQTAATSVGVTTIETDTHHVTLNGVELRATTTTTTTNQTSSSAGPNYTYGEPWVRRPFASSPTTLVDGLDSGSCVPYPYPTSSSTGGTYIPSFGGPPPSSCVGIGGQSVGVNPTHNWAYSFAALGPYPDPLLIYMQYGSWQTFLGAWCYSQVWPLPNPVTNNYAYAESGNGDLKLHTNTRSDPSVVRFDPIWVLPKVSY